MFALSLIRKIKCYLINTEEDSGKTRIMERHGIQDDFNIFWYYADDKMLNKGLYTHIIHIGIRIHCSCMYLQNCFVKIFPILQNMSRTDTTHRIHNLIFRHKAIHSVEEGKIVTKICENIQIIKIIQFICILESQVVECSMGSFYTQRF